MGSRITQMIDGLKWRSKAATPTFVLATALYDLFAQQRPHFNEIAMLNERPPSGVMTLAQWSHPCTLTSLMASYSNHIYRDQPTLCREHKPLKSLWTQWYIGLMVPPVLLALLTQPQALDISPSRFQVEFNETGRAARFWIDVHEDRQASHLHASGRLEKLIVEGISPVIEALNTSGDINTRLIWSNTGYLINWFLGEIKALLSSESLHYLRQTCFFNERLYDNAMNPLYRTVTL